MLLCKCYFFKVFRLQNGLKVEQFERILWGYYPLDSLLGLIDSLSEAYFFELTNKLLLVSDRIRKDFEVQSLDP